jgi:putative lipoic acid-binding regulatory protein
MHDGADSAGDTQSPVVGLTYPCIIDIKVFLHAQDNNAEFVRDVLLMSISSDELLEISKKESRNGKYHSYSCRVNARDQEQMDALFTRLTSHPDVLMVI